MTEQGLTGKVGVVFGVANAWAIAKAWAATGARLILNYRGEFKRNVEELVGNFWRENAIVSLRRLEGTCHSRP
jgi:enoyl-[acyl-carrier-protein] reductase (NADH)